MSRRFKAGAEQIGFAGIIEKLRPIDIFHDAKLPVSFIWKRTKNYPLIATFQQTSSFVATELSRYGTLHGTTVYFTNDQKSLLRQMLSILIMR